jgi:hypothetical protein
VGLEGRCRSGGLCRIGQSHGMQPTLVRDFVEQQTAALLGLLLLTVEP